MDLWILEDYEVHADKSWSRITPQFALDVRISEQLFGYVRYSQGYKSGGFQGQAPTAAVAANPFEPEIAAIPSYTLTHLRLAWRPDDDLELAAWVQNLFDERYMLHNFAVTQTGLATPGPPRIVGLSLRYDFGP